MTESVELIEDEFLEKYGDIEVTFSRYYKYVFYYEGMLPDGKKVVVGCGGDSSDIYRHEVIANLKETVRGIWPFKGFVYEGDKEIEHFYNF